MWLHIPFDKRAKQKRRKNHSLSNSFQNQCSVEGRTLIDPDFTGRHSKTTWTKWAGNIVLIQIDKRIFMAILVLKVIFEVKKIQKQGKKTCGLCFHSN